MKLTYRLAAVLVFGLTAIAAYILWSNNFYTFAEKNGLIAPQTVSPIQTLLSRPVIYDPSNNKIHDQIINPKSVFQSSERVFHFSCNEVTNSATTDLNTYHIIHNLDAVYNTSWIRDNAKAKKDIYQQYIKTKTTPSKSQINPLKVIVLPHSHSDPGWLKSIEHYFEDQTRKTLNFMLEKLTKYPDMTFVWAESVFLSMWWKDLSNKDKESVKRLVDRNQLEIAVGSWVVPDEANPSLFGLIDQMIEGHQWLEQNLGVKPQNTWSLDPFGYTSSLPYLYKRAGFQNMIILRVHQFVKSYLENSQNLDFLWRQHWDNEGRTDMLTSMLPYTLYNIKHQCGPDQATCLKFDFRNIPMENSEADAEPITQNNVKHFAKKLLHQYQKKNELYKHNVVLIPIGDDFRYDRSIEWDQQYGNYSKLFEYMNSDKALNVEIGFGTLRDYFEALRESVKSNAIQIPTLQGDFFPYNDRSEDYWTGYFTSRAYDKNFGREIEQHLRAAEILNVLAKARGGFSHYNSHTDMLTTARQALALFQHHDAITGTARAYVVIDYEQRLFEALHNCQSVLATSAQHLLAKPPTSPSKLNFEIQQPKSLYQLMPTDKKVNLENDFSTIVVFNPTAQPREDVVRVTISTDSVEVFDADDNIVLSQINPLWMASGEMYRNAFELVFIAIIPRLSLSRYNVKVVPKTDKPKENMAAFLSFSNMDAPKLDYEMRFKITPPKSETIMLENDYLRARFSAVSGLLQSVTTKTKLATTSMTIESLMYKSRRSGAYIFDPTGPATDSEMFNKPPIKVIKGPVMSEIRFTQRNSAVTQIVRIYNCSGILGSVLEINNIANLSTLDNHELIMRVSAPDIVSKRGVFYTDLNGLHTVKRKRFKKFPRQANFYPMTSFAYIEDSVQRLSIISAQPLGVSSQEESSLEVMLDRRLLYDDGRGLGEGVRDTKRTPSRFYLLLERRSAAFNESNIPSLPVESERVGTIASSPSLQAHLLARQLQNQFFVMAQSPTEDNTPVNVLLEKNFQPLTGPLPCDVDLVNLRAINLEVQNLGVQTRQKSQSSSAALILHKLGFDCQFPLMGFQCDSNNYVLVPSKLFTGAKLSSMTEMSLSLMHELHDIDLDTKMYHNPMELYTYKLNFE